MLIQFYRNLSILSQKAYLKTSDPTALNQIYKFSICPFNTCKCQDELKV